MENESTQTPLMEESLKHQLGMLVIGTAAGFAATKLANYIYKVGVEAYRARNTNQTEE